MSELKKYIYLEDGRKAERRVSEQQCEDCQSETVTELWEEKPVPKFLTQRIVEKKKPMIVEREVQVLGEDGETVVETRRETLEPDKLQLREVTKYNQVSEPDPLQVMKDDLELMKQEQADLRQEMLPKDKNIIQQRVSAQSVLGERVEDEKKLNLWDVAGLAVILAQIGAVAYFLLYF